jgi:hypothetical protein
VTVFTASSDSATSGACSTKNNTVSTRPNAESAKTCRLGSRDRTTRNPETPVRTKHDRISHFTGVLRPADTRPVR